MKKKKKQNEEFEKENFFDVIKRNCDNVPAFKALLKLGGYFIFFIVFLLVVSLSSNNNQTTIDDTQTKVEEKKTYNEILKDFETKENLNFKILFSDIEYYVKETVSEDNIDGYIESNEGTNHFKIKDNQIYEIKMNDEKLNPSLFNGFDIRFLNNSFIVSLTNNKQALVLNDNKIITYEYDYNDYKISIVTANNKIDNILLSINGIDYKIIYE